MLMMNLPEPESHIYFLVDDIQWYSTQCVLGLNDDDDNNDNDDDDNDDNDFVDDELTRTREPRISSR